MYKEYIKKQKNQQAKQRTLRQPIEFVENPVGFVLTEARSPEARRVLNVFLGFDNHFENIYPTLETIADKAGCSTKTVTRWTNKWASNGILQKEYRSNHSEAFYTSNVYKVNQLFHNETIRSQLKGILYSLGYLSIKILKLTKQALDRAIEKSVPRYSSNDSSINLDLNNCKSIYGNENKIVKRSVNALEDYGFLCDSGRYLAIQMGLTPFKAAYLSLVPEKVLLQVLRAYALAQRKQVPKDNAKFIGAILTNKLKEFGEKIDYSFVNAVTSHYQLDESWTKLSFEEKSILSQQTSHIGRNIELTLQGEMQNTKEQLKTSEDPAVKKDKERIERLRSNPYSCYYVAGYRKNKVLPVEEKEIPCQIAATPPEKISIDYNTGKYDLDMQLEKLNNKLQLSIKSEADKPLINTYRVDNFKKYIDELLPPFVEKLRQANLLTIQRIRNQIEGQLKILTSCEIEYLNQHGYSIDVILQQLFKSSNL